MKIHELKTWPDLFWETKEGAITAEFRKNDRGFEGGDLIDLVEYVPTKEEWIAQGRAADDYDYNESWEPGKATGERCWLRISHIKDDSYGFGIPKGYVVLSVERIKFVAA